MSLLGRIRERKADRFWPCLGVLCCHCCGTRTNFALCAKFELGLVFFHKNLLNILWVFYFFPKFFKSSGGGFCGGGVLIFISVVLYLRTISGKGNFRENHGKRWNFSQKKCVFLKNTKFSNLFHCILVGKFVENHGKSHTFLMKKCFLKKIEFSNLCYSILGSFLGEGISEKIMEKPENFREKKYVF